MHTVQEYDLVVVGHGAAGLAAAVTYAEAREGARIAVLERAPREERGGATRWTGAFRARLPRQPVTGAGDVARGATSRSDE